MDPHPERVPNRSADALPVGEPLPSWEPRPWPDPMVLEGRYARLEPLEIERHAEPLFHANQADVDAQGWTYLGYGPFDDVEAYRQWMDETATGRDPSFYAIVPLGRRPLGVASYMRMAPEVGSIEVGHIRYAPALQRTPAATEAMYLMMRRAFDALGYRRYEWKCDALNAASRRAAARLGFTYEGTFRQATIYKGRNRDTAWYSIVDGDWPGIRDGLEHWLDPGNFDGAGVQRRALEDVRAAAR